jgi:FkbM family methyltransferase
LLETIHRVGSRIRHSPFLQRQAWLWERVEPYWQAAFERVLKDRGFRTQVNGDVFVLEYALGARYDRQDQRAYEPAFYNPFVDRIQPGMTVADIGAHFGFFSLGAALRVGNHGRVFSFEPSAKTAATLRHNILLNHWESRVEVVEQVVSDKEGLVTFYTYGTSMAASLSRENVEILNPEHPPAASEEKVPAVTLDRFCNSRNVQFDVIKIDVEGAELLVLKGSHRLLASQRPVVLCEIHPLQMQQCGGSIDEFHQFIKSISYELQALDTPNPAGIFHAVLSPSV